MIDHGQWTRVPGRSDQHYVTGKQQKTQAPASIYSSVNNNNPYHVLSDPDHPQLQKLTLPDGSVVYSEHNSIQQLFHSLRDMINGFCAKTPTTKKLRVTNASNNYYKKAELQRDTSLIERVREHTIKSTFKKNKRKKTKKLT